MSARHDLPAAGLATLEHFAERSGKRIAELEEQVAVLVRCVAAINRELAELRSLLFDHAAELAGLLAERGRLPAGATQEEER